MKNYQNMFCHHAKKSAAHYSLRNYVHQPIILYCLHKSSFSLEADEELTLAVVLLSSKVRYVTQELLNGLNRIPNGKLF